LPSTLYDFKRLSLLEFTGNIAHIEFNEYPALSWIWMFCLHYLTRTFPPRLL